MKPRLGCNDTKWDGLAACCFRDWANFVRMNKPSQVIIYTDGACSGNPGPGGYGVVMMHGDHRRELSAGYRLTTNNRMELLAVITALQTLKQPCAVTLYSDSKYVIDAITQRWVYGWQQRGWRKSDKSPALNVDLWEQLLPLLKRHTVTFQWVRGHSANVENERCDYLAVQAAKGPELLVDEGCSKVAA